MKILCKYDELIAVTRLKPYPRNRNSHSKKQVERLAKLIEYQGMRAPIVVVSGVGNEPPDGHTIAKGHGTLLALKHLGWDQAPIVYQAFDDEDQLYAFVQSDNAIAAWSELDLKAINLDIPDLGPFDIDLLGIEDFEVEVADKNENDPDAIPENVKAVTKPGDIWTLGQHRLLCGDSTNPQDVEILMAGEIADLIFTDPPYGVSYQTDMTLKEAKARNRRTDGKQITNDTRTGEELQKFLSAALYGSPLKKGGVFYICSPAGSTETDFRLALGGEFPLRQALVWAKQQFVFGRQDYHWKHETILYGWREGAPHYFVDDRTQDTVWTFDRPRKSPEHPTMKPVELIEKAIRNSSKQKQKVYDGFLGSGSTLIACQKANRVCYGMELDPNYCDVVVKRWEEYTGKKASRTILRKKGKKDEA